MHLDAELLVRDVGHELVLADLIPDRNNRNARSADAHAQRDAQLVVRGFSAMGAGTSYSAMPRRAIRRSTGAFLFSRPPSTGP